MPTTTCPTPPTQSTLQERGQQVTRQVRDMDAEHWTALLGGGVLALCGLRRGGLSGLGLALLGGSLAYKGSSGRIGTGDNSRASQQGITVRETLAINSSPQELYRYWRNFDNLPRFMRYLESVRSTEGNRSHWVARGPLNIPVEW